MANETLTYFHWEPRPVVNNSFAISPELDAVTRRWLLLSCPSPSRILDWNDGYSRAFLDGLIAMGMTEACTIRKILRDNERIEFWLEERAVEEEPA